jgi:hypothetical protein
MGLDPIIIIGLLRSFFVRGSNILTSSTRHNQRTYGEEAKMENSKNSLRHITSSFKLQIHFIYSESDDLTNLSLYGSHRPSLWLDLE